MKIRPLLLVCLLFLGSPAAGQDREAATNLDELLRQVEEGRARDQREHREREARFRAARDDQQELLVEAREQASTEEDLRAAG